MHTGDHGGLDFAIVDKKAARLFVFTADGHLKGASPVLLGLARGDDSVPGIGTRKMADIRPAERTTPAGRFVSSPGENMSGEHVIWVDYDAAVSMHSVRATVARERRIERLASGDPAEHRISWGCINVPAAFFKNVAGPTFANGGGVIYVLPETRSLDAQFPMLASRAGSRQ
ncbi:MAG: L,D-transpeptidase [Caldimonas sp.]